MAGDILCAQDALRAQVQREVLGGENFSELHRERSLKSRIKEPGKPGFLWEQTTSPLGEGGAQEGL